jgi:hypothetical protein
MLNIPPVPPVPTDTIFTHPLLSTTASFDPIFTDPLLSSVTGYMSIPAGETPISTGEMSIPAEETPTGEMSIPAGETPISTGEMPTGEMSIPAGETPISTGDMDVPVASNATVSPTLSATSSAPLEVSENVAAPTMKADAMQFVAAVAGALALL